MLLSNQEKYCVKNSVEMQHNLTCHQLKSHELLLVFKAMF